MALVLSDRVKVRSTSTGTGAFALENAVQGFQDFSVIGDGNETFYGIVDALGNWEIGRGTYTASGNTLSRDQVLESSNNYNLVNFSGGSKNVFCTFPASLALQVLDFVSGSYSGEFVGNVRGSVFADNSTLLVDGTNGTIPYSVLSNTPTIPTDVSDLTDTTDLIPADISDLTDTGNLLSGGFSGSYNDLTNTPVIPADVSDLTDTGNLLGGSGDGVVEGSIYKIDVAGDDSTVLVNSANSSINLDGTVKGDIIPDQDVAYDIGSPTYKFRDIYLSGSSINLGSAQITATGSAINLPVGSTVGGQGISGGGGGDGVVEGSIYKINIAGDDSTLLVDATNSTIPYAVLSGAPAIPTDIGDLTDTGNLLGGGGDGVVEGSIYKINIAGDDSTLLVDSDNGKIVGYVENDRFTVDGSNYQVRIGVGAGAISQSNDAIAIGEGAGNYQQGTRSVAIGRGSGNADQGISAVGIGFCAGGAEQGDYAVAIGFKAGRGPMAGDPDPAQPNNSIIINASGDKLNGTNSGLYIDPVREDTGNTAKAIYYNTTTKELTYANSTGGGGDGVVEGSIYKINIAGDDSTLLVDSDNGKIVGYVENDQYNYNTNTQSLRIGGGAGETSQGDGAVALGQGAGNYQQENQAVAVGRGSGNYLQGNGAVGIGFCAGATEQGDYAVAIGFKAARGNMDGDGTPNQPANSIMINASSTPLNGDQAGLYINPVREDEANVTKLVYYNTTTKELTYANPTLVSDNDINVTINSESSTSYSWNFNQLGFLEIPNINNQLGGIIGDTLGDGMIGIKASEAADSYVELTNRDGSAGIFVQGDSTLTGESDIQVAIYTTNSGGMEFYGDGNAELFGDLSLGGIKSVHGIDERSTPADVIAGVLTINFNERNGAVRNINASGGFPFPPSFTANFTVNLTGFTLQQYHFTTVRVEIEQHSSAGYYPSVLQIDGVAQTIQWEGGVNPAPIGGTRDLAVFYIRNTSSSPTPAYSVIGHYIGGDQTRFDGDVTGSVFADDSTLLVDAVSGIVPAEVVLGTFTGNMIGNVTGDVTGNINGTVGATTAAAGSFTTLNTSGQVVFNDAGADVDFRVEGDTDANLLFVDASADAVGIGTGTPTQPLEIRTDTDKITQFLSGSGTAVQWQTINDAKTANVPLIISTSETSFFTGGTERIRVTNNGLTFNGDTAAANALDDYEEGTWTPVYTADSVNPTVTYSSQEGIYTKIGDTVFVSCEINAASSTGGSGTLRVAGLPFNVKNSTAGRAAGFSINYSEGFSSTTTPTSLLTENNANFAVCRTNATSDSRSNKSTSVAVSEIASGGRLFLSMTYKVN